VEFPYRVIITTDDGNESQVIRLPRAPDIGEEVDLPHGVQVRVWRVLSANENSVAGVILAERLPLS
jgi:hypothetical protein